VNNRDSDYVRYMQILYKAWYREGKPLKMCVCSRFPCESDSDICIACTAALFHTVDPDALMWYDKQYRFLYTQKDKYELLKMLVVEVEGYQYDAASVDQILAVWQPWISESNNTSETLSRQQKKDWKKRENKMKALLAAMAEKHALRKE